MLEEITVVVDESPGILAKIGELLGARGVNIETLSASSFDGRGVIHLVVDDGEDAAEALMANGFEVEGTRRVLAVSLDDQPGELGRYCRRLHDAGVNIFAAYVARRGAGETEMIFAVDDVDAAHSA
ncbi:MAG TPA: ACT domain-containing protein [Actinomycetota bacterium]|nr:ACT domain-containing protein [Actinomycetota bacterium]